MLEIKNILRAYQQAPAGIKMALATVVYVEGSAYRRTGARMLILENGQWVGGISGGCLEGDALRKAKLAMLHNKPTIVTYDTREEDTHQIGVGLGCNGLIEVLITPIDRTSQDHPLAILAQCTQERKVHVLLNVLSGKQQGRIFPFQDQKTLEVLALDATAQDALLKKIKLATDKQKSTLFEDKTIQCFIEILPPPTRLLIFGNNYDIYPLADIATRVGWEVIVVTQPEKINTQLNHHAQLLAAQDFQAALYIDDFTVAVCMAHDYKTDKANLQLLARTSIRYIGMLGPKKRTHKILHALETAGIQIATDKVFAPVGLDIGASTPEEIAVSIIAEVRAVFADRSGQHLRLRETPIYAS